MTNAKEARACAMRYELAQQTVGAGESLRLSAWEVRGAGILAEGETGLMLGEGCYLLQFSCQSLDAGAAVSLNDARVAYLEASPLAGTQRIALQGIVRLHAPGTLRVCNSGAQPGQYREAVLTVVRVE